MVRRLRPRRVVPAGDHRQEGGLRPEQDVVFRRKNLHLVHVPASRRWRDGVGASRRWRMSPRGCPPPAAVLVDGVYSARRRFCPLDGAQKQSFGHRRRFSAAPTSSALVVRRHTTKCRTYHQDQVVDAVAVERPDRAPGPRARQRKALDCPRPPAQILQRRRPEERRPC